MTVLVIDFETKDPYIDKGVGAGWVYGINVKNSPFRVLGVAIKEDEKESKYFEDRPMKKEHLSFILSQYIRKADTLVMHNASYDLGCLDYLNVDYSHCTIFDTMIAGKIHDSSLMSYSLDNLANKYLSHQKKSSLLGDAIWEAGVYPWLAKELTEQAKANKNGIEYVRTKPDQSKLDKFAKANMDLVQDLVPEAMAEYAKADVDLTYKLYKYYLNIADIGMITKYSFMSVVTNSYRKKGVRVNLQAARQVSRLLQIEIESTQNKLFSQAGQQFNISSQKEVSEVLHRHGIECPKTPLGNPSAVSGWLEKQNNEICKSIVETRKLTKIKNDFIDKIIQMQEYTCPDAEDYGRIYPELNLFQAVTGRFSSSNPNIQQIPSRDEKLAPLCRSLFSAEEGEKLYSLDYSNQEGRLQVHYAYMLKCEGSSEIKVRFDNDPNYDMHGAVAKQMHVDRRVAKSINLGLSYGMGSEKLAAQLGVDVNYARDTLMYNYYKWVPWLCELKKKCQDRMKEAGEIRTICGRKLKLDPPSFVGGKKNTFEYKALNKLIQGSAADQTIEAMLQAYKEGIPVLFPVHDQLLISGTREQAVRLKEIMENCVKLCIPVVVDVNLAGGDSWATAGH